MDRLFIFAIAIVLAGFLSGGVYSVADSGNTGAVIVNRFTGNGWYCGLLGCSPLTFKISN